MNIRKENGITLLALVLTITIMLILAGIVITSSTELYEGSKKETFIYEMQLIQIKVDSMKSSELASLGQVVSELEQDKQDNVSTAINSAVSNLEITDGTISNYRYFNSENVSDLGIDEVNREFLVNPTTKDIVSLLGFEYSGNTYFTQYTIPNGNQKSVEFAENVTSGDFDISVNIDGLNAEIIVTNAKVIFDVDNEAIISNPKLSYREQNGYWQDMQDNKATVSKTATYEVKLVNGSLSSSVIKTIDIVLANKPILADNYIPTIIPKVKGSNNLYITLTNETKWYDYSSQETFARGEKNGQMYIWIPQYMYKEEEGVLSIKFLKGNSKIATDNILLDNTWTKEDYFLGEKEDCLLTQTGMWIKETAYLSSTLKIKEYNAE